MTEIHGKIESITLGTKTFNRVGQTFHMADPTPQVAQITGPLTKERFYTTRVGGMTVFARTWPELKHKTDQVIAGAIRPGETWAAFNQRMRGARP